MPRSVGLQPRQHAGAKSFRTLNDSGRNLYPGAKGKPPVRSGTASCHNKSTPHIHVGAHTLMHKSRVWLDIIKASFPPCTKPAVDVASGTLSSSGDSGILTSSIAGNPSTLRGTGLPTHYTASGRAGSCRDSHWQLLARRLLQSAEYR